MPVSWVYWLALVIPLGGLVYLWLLDRRLARIGVLSNDLEQRTDSEGAFQVAHRICAGIEGLAIEHPESDVSSCVTVSIGVATSTPAVDSNWEELELVRGATGALERAKQSGRNRVSIDAAEQPT